MTWKRAVCRLRGHQPRRQILRLGDESMDERSYCWRCDTTLATATRPVLLTLHSPYMPPRHCYATGQTGDCGHELASACMGCLGDFCPTCDWICESCRAFKGAVQRLLDDGLVQLESEIADVLRQGGPAWPMPDGTDVDPPTSGE